MNKKEWVLLKKDFPYLKWFKLLGMALFVATFVYAPVLYRYISHGIVYSGVFDGIKQLVPFQMFLYERMTSFHQYMILVLG